MMKNYTRSPVQTNSVIYEFPVQRELVMGWVCPKCGRVYSPYTPMCLYCGDAGTTVTTTGTGMAERKE